MSTGERKDATRDAIGDTARRERIQLQQQGKKDPGQEKMEKVYRDLILKSDRKKER